MKEFKVTLSLTNGERPSFVIQSGSYDDVFSNVYHGGEIFRYDHGRAKHQVRVAHISHVSVVELKSSSGPEPS